MAAALLPSSSAPRCSTAPFAPPPAAMRSSRPMAPRSACTCELFGESKLIVIWGSNSIASEPCISGPWRRQAKRAGREVDLPLTRASTETAEKCHQHIALRPGTDGALALGADARIASPMVGSTTTTSRTMYTDGCRCAGASVLRCTGRPSARPHRSAASRPTRCAAWRATYGTTQAGGDPPQLRHAARASGGGNARRASSRCCPASPAPGVTAPVACCCRASGWFKRFLQATAALHAARSAGRPEAHAPST